MFNLNFEIDLPKDQVTQLDLDEENKIAEGINVNNKGEVIKLSEKSSIATILLNLTIDGFNSIPFGIIASYLYEKLKGKTDSITFIKERKIKVNLKKETIEETLREIYTKNES